MNNLKNKKITGLVLSAGLSDRMGAYKPLLQFKGKTFIQNVIEKLNDVCYQIIVVIGYRSLDIEKSLKNFKNEEISSKIQFVFNEDFKDGMFLSLQKGIGACSEADWILYHFVDQPSLPSEFYTEFVEQIDDKYDWVQPVKNNRRGHPILFSNRVSKMIMKSPISSNLKELSQLIKNQKYWQCNYNQIFDDIDNIADYNNLIGKP